MKAKKDHPGVYPPPPLFYVVIFLFSIFIQKYVALPIVFFENKISLIPGIAFIIIGLLCTLPAVLKFIESKNTLITIKPANSLQTTGIYSISRNPMYLGLLIIYVGIAFFLGNWWTFIFIPLVILIITNFVIVNEEKYLGRTFGKEFLKYKKSVRRWL
jgi:protein-S-isoprenylcysteine O-methyltransferase Ste14